MKLSDHSPPGPKKRSPHDEAIDRIFEGVLGMFVSLLFSLINVFLWKHLIAGVALAAVFATALLWCLSGVRKKQHAKANSSP